MKSNNKLKLNLFFTTKFETLVQNQNYWKPENTELKVGNSILHKLCTDVYLQSFTDRKHALLLTLSHFFHARKKFHKDYYKCEKTREKTHKIYSCVAEID